MAPDLKTQTKRALLKPARFFNSNFAYTERLSMAFARGALNVATRRLDPLRPTTWEFSALSQNGEDGIIDHLLSLVEQPNRYFVEIGASDGLENNTGYLAYAKKYSGVMVDANSFKIENARRFLEPLNWSVKYLDQLVDADTVGDLTAECVFLDPDFLSLDIDSNDYFVMKSLLDHGLRGKVVCVEYNSAFGPTASISIRETKGLDYLTYHPSQLYYGVSVSAWRTLFAQHGYDFVTVDTRGVNAFFAQTDKVNLPSELEGLPFAENAGQLRRHGVTWEEQFAKVSHLGYIDVR